MFLCASGTIFGRDVVPEVCSTSAMSSGVAARTGLPRRRASAVELERERARAVLRCATSRTIGTPSFCATSTAGESLPARDDEHLGAQIGEIELELLGAIRRD